MSYALQYTIFAGGVLFHLLPFCVTAFVLLLALVDHMDVLATLLVSLLLFRHDFYDLAFFGYSWYHEL